MTLSRVQASVPEEMHKNMCLLADKQGIGVSTLYRNIMLSWYEENFLEKSIFWEVKKSAKKGSP